MSPISLLTNLLILLVQPVVMLAGGLATMAGMIWLPLACTVWVVQGTAALPFALLSLGRFSPWLLAAIYAGLVGGNLDRRRPTPLYAVVGDPALRTNELGTVEFITNGKRLWVETAR
jgi:hypothetical protein